MRLVIFNVIFDSFQCQFFEVFKFLFQVIEFLLSWACRLYDNWLIWNCAWRLIWLIWLYCIWNPLRPMRELIAPFFDMMICDHRHYTHYYISLLKQVRLLSFPITFYMLNRTLEFLLNDILYGFEPLSL